MTGQAVFDLAIHLMDEQNESTGSTNTSDTKEYRLRAVSALNSTLPTVCAMTACEFTLVSALEDTLPVPDPVAAGVCGYLLAAYFARTDGDEEKALRWETLANGNLSVIASRLSNCEMEDIGSLYGGIEHGEFSRW